MIAQKEEANHKNGHKNKRWSILKLPSKYLETSFFRKKCCAQKYRVLWRLTNYEFYTGIHSSDLSGSLTLS